MGVEIQLQLQLVTVGVAAARFGQSLIAAAPVYGELSDQMVPVEDQQVITGGEHQQHPACEFGSHANTHPIPVQEAALFDRAVPHQGGLFGPDRAWGVPGGCDAADRKSTRLNSSHQIISYAVFCLKKKKHN